jgi:hypothetical protein
MPIITRVIVALAAGTVLLGLPASLVFSLVTPLPSATVVLADPPPPCGAPGQPVCPGRANPMWPPGNWGPEGPYGGVPMNPDGPCARYGRC